MPQNHKLYWGKNTSLILIAIDDLIDQGSSQTLPLKSSLKKSLEPQASYHNHSCHPYQRLHHAHHRYHGQVKKTTIFIIITINHHRHHKSLSPLSSS